MDDLTLDEKNEDRICMGENALREESCNFPGLGEYYDEAIDESDPTKPAEPGKKPEETVLPEKSADPANPNSVRDLQAYLNDLNIYNEEVARLQDEYKEKIDAWQDDQEQYKDKIETYQEDMTELEDKRALATGSTEVTIKRYKNDYGWTFLDKENREKYLNTIFKTWIAQLVIIVVVLQEQLLCKNAGMYKPCLSGSLKVCKWMVINPKLPSVSISENSSSCEGYCSFLGKVTIPYYLKLPNWV